MSNFIRWDKLSGTTNSYVNSNLGNIIYVGVVNFYKKLFISSYLNKNSLYWFIFKINGVLLTCVSNYIFNSLNLIL